MSTSIERIPGSFTAAEIAYCLGRPVRSIRRQLANIEPTDTAFISGNPAAAWAFYALPAKLSAELEAEAKRRALDNVEHLVKASPQPWQPPIAWGNIIEAERSRAQQLCKVFAPLLQYYCSDHAATMASLARRAAEAMLAELREQRSERQLMRIAELALNRDQGRMEFQRAELYLPKQPSPAHKPRQASHRSTDFSGLIDFCQALADPHKPSPQDKAQLFDIAFAILADAEDSKAEKKARNRLPDIILEYVPGISKSRHSLYCQLKNKYAAWQEGGLAAVKDKRKGRSGNKAPVIPDNLEYKLLARALNVGGGLSQAWRELWEEDAIPPEIQKAYPFDWSRKSYVPPPIRELGPKLESLRPDHQGARAAALNEPNVHRDWSKVEAGIQAQSDDLTVPFYVWIEDETTRSGYKLIRPQCLVWVDTRTRFVYFAQLLPRAQYGSEDILRGIARLNDVYALPDELRFEKGIWERSHAIKGREGDYFRGRIYGLQQMGMKLTHARKPQDKVVEGVLGKLQDRMENFRGYCGRNERIDLPEHVKAQSDAVKAGKVHPARYFMNMEEATAEMARICNAYNLEIQNGTELDGLSPTEAFAKYQRKSPPIKLEGPSRQYVATHRREVKITNQGIRIKIGKNVHYYRNEETGRREGHRVLAWFDIEDATILTVTDTDGRNAFAVEKATMPAAINPAKEDLTAAIREIKAHASAKKAYYTNLKDSFPEEFQHRRARGFIHSEDDIERDRVTREAKVAKQKADRQHRHEQKRQRVFEEKTGHRLTGRQDRIPRKLEALETINDFLNDKSN